MTLIELMIVLAIVSVVSTIAVSVYDDQSMKKNRVIAISSLLQSRAQLEKCFLNNRPNNYSGCVIDAAKSIDTKNIYTITPNFVLDSNGNRTAYTLTANTNSKSTDADKECSSFSITNIGIKSNAGTGSLQRCWSQ